MIKVKKKNFSPQEILNAQELMNTYMEILAEELESEDLGERRDEFYASAHYQKYKHALPSQFTFSFPMINENKKEQFPNGLDSAVFLENSTTGVDSLTVFFENSQTEDIEIGLNYILIDVLPQWGTFGDYSLWEMNQEDFKLTINSNDLTVRQLIIVLMELGFQYKKPEQYYFDAYILDEEIKELIDSQE